MMMKEEITVCFAHSAYQMAARFAERDTGITHFQVWEREAVNGRIAECNILVVSGFWHNRLIGIAPNLQFVQSISAGVNQYDQAKLKQAGIRLANAAGVNAHAVAEHSLAHMLSFSRLMHLCRDQQHQKLFRGMISNPAEREQELGGKTILIVGLGRIGQRLAKLAKAFDMRVIGTKRDTSVGLTAVDALHSPEQLPQLLPQADFVVLTCPLTPETTRLIDQDALHLMKPSSYLINMARGQVVEEQALIAALTNNNIAGAGLDTFVEEPLPPNSPLWEMENVIITPHTAGETQRYEDAVIDILLENIERLSRGEQQLLNQIV